MGWLAIAQNEKYNLMAESNRVSTTLVPPRRGWIVDRHGRPIANNRTDLRVDIIPDRLAERERVLPLLGQLLALTPEELTRIGIDLDNAAGFQPVKVAENIDWERFAAVSLRQPELPGVAPTRGFARHYPSGAAVAHLTGYVGAPNAEQYKATHDPLMVVPGFKIGKDGLEKTLEASLRGQPGAKRMEVTARGRPVAELPTRVDVPGAVAAADDRCRAAGLCRAADRHQFGVGGGARLPHRRDAGHGVDARLRSQQLLQGISHLEWQMLADDDHVPLMNKVTQGLYPPGSTVKPMNGIALLQNGVDPHARINCSGSLRVGTGIFHCHKKSGHGALDLKNAIMQSCDIYFYEMVRRLGYDRVAPVARSRWGSARNSTCRSPGNVSAPCPTARGSSGGTRPTGPSRICSTPRSARAMSSPTRSSSRSWRRGSRAGARCSRAC